MIPFTITDNNKIKAMINTSQFILDISFTAQIYITGYILSPEQLFVATVTCKLFIDTDKQANTTQVVNYH